MNTNDASRKFKRSASDIRVSAKNGLIPNAYKKGFRWVIPDDTRVILTKNEIKCIITNIIRYKTGVTNKFSIKGLKDNDKKYVIIFDLLCKIEFMVCDSGKFIDVYKYLKKINLCEKAIGYLNVDIRMEIKNKINIVERINVGIINIK